MDKKYVMRIGSIEIQITRIDSELLAIFRDDMIHTKYAPAGSVWPGHWPGLDSNSGPEVPVSEYRIAANQLADRLDLMGFEKYSALAMISGMFAADRTLSELGFISLDDEKSELRTLDGNRWVERVRLSSSDVQEPSLNSRSWLLDQIRSLDALWQLRALLIAFPEVDVIFEITGMELLEH